MDLFELAAIAKRGGKGGSGGSSTSSDTEILSPIKGAVSGKNVRIQDSLNKGILGVRIFGKTTQAATPSPENPQDMMAVGADGDIEVMLVGDNLIQFPYFDDSETSAGVTFTVNDDTSISLNGTSTRRTSFTFDLFKVEKGTYTLSARGNGSGPLLRVLNQSKNEICAEMLLDGTDNKTITFTLTEPRSEIQVYLSVDEPDIICSGTVLPALTKGQSITIPTPNGLRGIPVLENGTYTDENGQQWICDEVDLERGVYVQRICEHVIDGSEKKGDLDGDMHSGPSTAISFMFNDIAMSNGFTPTCLCNQLPYVQGCWSILDAVGCGTKLDNVFLRIPNDLANISDEGLEPPDAMDARFSQIWWHVRYQYQHGNPYVIQYALIEPIETPLSLSEEDLAAFKEMCNDKCIVNISNDADTHMTITYAVDTQEYLEANYVSKEEYEALADKYVSKEEYEALDINLASAIKPVASGSAITLRDSADKKLSGMRIFGKTEQKTTTGAQLWDNEKAKDPTFWIVESGLSYAYADFTLKPNTTYTISMVANNMPIDNPNLTNTYAFYIGERKGTYENNTMIGNTNADTGKTKYTFTTTENQMYFNVYPKQVSTETLTLIFEELLQNIMLNEGSTPLPYEPYTGGQPSPNPEYPQEMVNVGESGNIEVTVHGKNLFDERYYYSVYSSGVPYIWNNNEVIFPYVPARESIGVCKIINCKKGITYAFSVTNPNKNWSLSLSEYPTFDAAFSKDNFIGYRGPSVVSSLTYTAKTDGILVCSLAGVWLDGVTNIHECTETELLQLEIGEVSTPYEPPLSAQPLTLSTPNGLPGVPVSADGNYTDESGQQWICDEIDLERGVYVKRVEKIDLKSVRWVVSGRIDGVTKYFQYGFLNVTPLFRSSKVGGTMSNIGTSVANPYDTIGNYVWAFHHTSGNVLRLGLDNSEIDTVDKLMEYLNNVDNTDCIYAIDTPIETPLSGSEIAAYRALHTNYPTTNIFNDANARMEVTYTADTENHIETNYVPKSDYEALEARVAALEQNALSV